MVFFQALHGFYGGDKDSKNDFDRFPKMIQDTIAMVVIGYGFRVQRF
jgi:hypothetical protein